jgi:hypothetical protein
MINYKYNNILKHYKYLIKFLLDFYSDLDSGEELSD